ncbi:MAG: rRNA pseudouridine synthase [Candidatus Pacebacteria bacterium]|jgi:23S rRNA pseudouridine2605 synthase|nr:rRNA pseudouridine synthase [Candidatus Paceibacterota bacterium]MBT4652190.1 rRNA pseudouridine synthase [Candidatus Paceibacterota bacterium]MBT6756621.1 rRNA pseudouridine synthase [Candidatus Paceibacterota bacterium]MBT6920871.1 rRNA pseudouridine synthase [Candidatus Paceibacterota bacterium]
MKIRLNKYLAQLGVASRRKVDELIEKKKVLINGSVARLGDKVDDSKDTIKIGRKSYAPSTSKKKLEYWMVYKPTGFVSSTSDPTGLQVVTSLVESDQRLYPVGRLDIDSEGMLILTNDGELTQRLTHPKNHVPKTYNVWVKGKLSRNGFDRIRRGLKMKSQRVSPAEIRVIEKYDGGAILEVILHQGMNRQIRRMMKAINLDVKRLTRVAVGSLTIGNLKSGEVRQLTLDEKQALLSKTIKDSDNLSE